MGNFDFIEASVKGYEFVWTQRSYLMRVVVPVLFVKVACLLGVFVLHLQHDYLLQGLVMLPAYVVEALFCVGLIRYMLYGEPIFIWGKVVSVPESGVEAVPYSGYYSRLQCYQGGIAMFLLIKVMLVLCLALMSVPASEPVEISGEPPEYPAGVYVLNAFIMFGFISALLWSVRLLWLYVPLVIGVPLKSFFKITKGMSFSFSVVLACLICALPLMTVFGVLFLISVEVLQESSANGIIVKYVIFAIADLVMIAIQTVAMVHGIRQIVSGTVKND